MHDTRQARVANQPIDGRLDYRSIPGRGGFESTTTLGTNRLLEHRLGSHHRRCEGHVGTVSFASLIAEGSKQSKRAFREKKKAPLQVIGWREWVGLPSLGIEKIKAKVDTGARSSSIHAFDVKQFDRDGETWVRFKVHPLQRRSNVTVEVESKLLESRSVRSSSGKASLRPVILADVSLMGVTWPVEITLANRDEMGFRMLLGRQAIRKRFLVDAGKSYFGGK